MMRNANTSVKRLRLLVVFSSLVASTCLAVLYINSAWTCGGGGSSPFIYVEVDEEIVDVTDDTLYVGLDSEKSTVGDYRGELGIEATGALDEDDYNYFEGTWKVSEEEDDADTLSDWQTDDTSVTGYGSEECTYEWDDVADEGGAAGDRKDGPFEASCDIVVVQPVIDAPSVTWIDSAPYRFAHQGVVSGAPGAYSIGFHGGWNGGGGSGNVRLLWDIGSCGSFDPETIHNAAPTYIPPASVPGWYQVGVAACSVEVNNFSEWELSGDEELVGFKVFDSHLSRDIDNQSALNGHNVTTNCTGAAQHAYNGTMVGGDPAPPWETQTGDGEELYWRSSRDPNDDAENPWTTTDTLKLNRGDCLTITGLCNHIVTVTADGSTGLWEYNGSSGQDFGESSVPWYLDWETEGELRVDKIRHWPKR